MSWARHLTRRSIWAKIEFIAFGVRSEELTWKWINHHVLRTRNKTYNLIKRIRCGNRKILPGKLESFQNKCFAIMLKMKLGVLPAKAMLPIRLLFFFLLSLFSACDSFSCCLSFWETVRRFSSLKYIFGLVWPQKSRIGISSCGFLSKFIICWIREMRNVGINWMSETYLLQFSNTRLVMGDSLHVSGPRLNCGIVIDRLAKIVRSCSLIELLNYSEVCLAFECHVSVLSKIAQQATITGFFSPQSHPVRVWRWKLAIQFSDNVASNGSDATSAKSHETNHRAVFSSTVFLLPRLDSVECVESDFVNRLLLGVEYLHSQIGFESIISGFCHSATLFFASSTFSHDFASYPRAEIKINTIAENINWIN